MNTLSNNIIDTLITEVNLINDKIKGLNFLEILKNNIIEKISPLLKDQNLTLHKFDQIEKVINTKERDIKISLEFVLNTSIITKKIIEEDTLFLSLNDSSSLDIYENDKNAVKIFLYKNTGISLSKNTIINAKFNKNALILQIQNKDITAILTK